MKTNSPLCRTKPSGRGVAPATARAARPAPDDRAAWPQDVATVPVGRSLPCESVERRIVNRPPRVVFTLRCGVGGSAGAASIAKARKVS